MDNRQGRKYNKRCPKIAGPPVKKLKMCETASYAITYHSIADEKISYLMNIVTQFPNLLSLTIDEHGLLPQMFETRSDGQVLGDILSNETPQLQHLVLNGFIDVEALDEILNRVKSVSRLGVNNFDGPTSRLGVYPQIKELAYNLDIKGGLQLFSPFPEVHKVMPNLEKLEVQSLVLPFNWKFAQLKEFSLVRECPVQNLRVILKNNPTIEIFKIGKYRSDGDLRHLEYEELAPNLKRLILVSDEKLILDDVTQYLPKGNFGKELIVDQVTIRFQKYSLEENLEDVSQVINLFRESNIQVNAKVARIESVGKFGVSEKAHLKVLLRSSPLKVDEVWK